MQIKEDLQRASSLETGAEFTLCANKGHMVDHYLFDEARSQSR